ncbi:hypothetical protein [Clostridium hydrogeniformans]|uniref:hypothetical protein n=1 Tax=Clostridium hydrogeniformans TaxID=349933 RepID=UPI00047FB5A5|nr:hypothetical protein [Clostridium hydrogeniformans]
MKKFIVFLSVILLSASCAFYFALNNRTTLPTRDISFDTPEDTIKYLFNNWHYTVKENKTYPSYLFTCEKPSKELLMAFSKRRQGKFFIDHEAQGFYRIDDFSVKVENLIIKDEFKETAISHKYRLNNMGIGVNIDDIKAIKVEYIGEPMYKEPSYEKVEKRRLISTVFLIQENDSWVIDNIVLTDSLSLDL